MIKRPSISFNLSKLPIDVKPYVDRNHLIRAQKLISALPHIQRNAYNKGTERFGALLVRIIRHAMKTGMPPGGLVQWDPLEPSTLKKYKDKGTGKPWYWLGQMYREIGIQNTKRNGKYVGFAPGIKALTIKRGETVEGSQTLNHIAKILETGTMDWIPPRPLFKPAYEYAKPEASKYLIQEIRKEINKYTIVRGRVYRKK